MDEGASLPHTKWECKYHVVFFPKCGRKTLYQEIPGHLGEVLRRPAGVSTIGRDEVVIGEYIRKQKEEDKQLDQSRLWR